MVGLRVSEAIGDAAVHERQSTPSAILSRLAEKRHANPYHINLKLYSPVYHVERAGLGCRPFNRVCGSFAASCQAALPQPLLACLSRLPCHGNHLSTLSSQRPLPCTKSGHCYGARKNRGKPSRTITSTSRHRRYEANDAVASVPVFRMHCYPQNQTKYVTYRSSTGESWEPETVAEHLGESITFAKALVFLHNGQHDRAIQITCTCSH